MFVRLNKTQLNQFLNFSKVYSKAENAASGSALDANANVSTKNIATEEAEIAKSIYIQINRARVSNKLDEVFPLDEVPAMSEVYNQEIEDKLIYVHDETSLKPYCVSVSMYPFLRDGLTKLGGESKAPKHLDSFCGSFVNLVFAISSQFAGAVATVEFLTYFDYFARKEYGENYAEHLLDYRHSGGGDIVGNLCERMRHEVGNHLQHVVYALNQPAAARGYQAVFWNISIFDQFYFQSMFENFVFPDMTCPSWESVDKLQRFFMTWFNKEREKALLTFPVVTAALLTDGTKPRDHQYANFLSKEMSEGNSFFVYMSQTADSLASCCRLRNEMTSNEFSYSLGAGGVMTGSINVITINMNRLLHKAASGYGGDSREEVIKAFHAEVLRQVQNVHMYQVAYRGVMQEYLDAKMLTCYEAGFIDMDKQFLTIGVNGLLEAAEQIGLVPDNNEEYRAFIKGTLKVIYDANREATTKYGLKFNTEFVPAENLGVKNSMWDQKDGIFSPRDCYNSYFYRVEDENISLFDKIMLYDRDMVEYLDGGSALHANLAELLPEDKWYGLLCCMAVAGVNYFCFNVKSTICNDCDNIDKHPLTACPKCGSANVDGATRVIGYLKRISSFSAPRQVEAGIRHYH